MYRPKHTVSKRRADRILRGIYACFFAALVIAFLMMPSGNVKAAGGGKGYPVDAFNGVWDFTEKEYIDVYTLTIQLNSDGTFYYAVHIIWPPGGSIRGEIEGLTEWYGTYTYNEETGELISNCISNSLDLAMGTMTEKDAWYLTDINTLEHHTLEFNGNVGGDVVSYYTRLSDTPPYILDEEEEASAEESIEEASAEESIEEEAFEEESEEAEEEETAEEEEFAEEAEQPEEPAEVPDQFLTDEEAEDLLVSIFEGDDQHLNQAKTAAAAVGMSLGAFVSALLASGTLGGAPTPPTVGGEGALPGHEDMGPGMVVDPEGDILYTNPVTGEMTVYTSNGDGTYKNVLTGVEVTVQDIKNRADYEFDNAAEIGLEQEKLEEWKEQQREANSVLSKEGQQAALDRIKQEEYLKEQDRKNQIMYKRGIYDGDEKAFKKEILKERQKEDANFGKYAAAGEYWDAATKTAQSVKKSADIAIDVMAEIEPTGAGKSIKNGYKFLAEAAGQGGKVMAGKQSLVQAIGKTIINGAKEYAKDNVDMTELKCMANITGDGTAAYINARIDGKTHEQALSKANDAAKSGAANFAVDYTVGQVMDGVTGGVEISDNKIYNGLYKNNNVNGSSISKLGLKMNKSGFTSAVVKNDRFKEGANALVSDIIKDAISDEDDD